MPQAGHHRELDRYLLDGERLVTAVHQHWGKVAEPVAERPRRRRARPVGGRHHPAGPRVAEHAALVGLVRRPRPRWPTSRGVAARLVRRHRQAAAAVLRLHHPQGVDDAAVEGHRHVLRALGPRPDPRLRPLRHGVGGPGPGAARGQLGPRTRTTTTARSAPRSSGSPTRHPAERAAGRRGPPWLPEPYAGWDDPRYGADRSTAIPIRPAPDGDVPDGSLYRSPDLRDDPGPTARPTPAPSATASRGRPAGSDRGR